ncbi:ABC transporter permease [bacterium]|nr:ABC transporter permease [bacterium]MBT3903914.1 ABC transporter permease [bacterium]MBT4577698.1 ABC transporter permease [bacterium]MBT5345525.1 ABC transporter permease [bacterium]MBT6131345.1 ABC transporter permease [bacterium]
MIEQEAKFCLRHVKAFVLGVPAFIWQFVFFYVPLFFLFIISITKSWNILGFGSITMANYWAMLAWAPVKIISASLLMAVMTTSICVVLAYPVVYFLCRYVGRLRSFMMFLLILPFWTNFLLHVYAWFMMLEKHGLVNNLLIKLGLISQPVSLLYSYLAIVIVMVHSYLPFMIFPLYSVMEKIDKQLLEASADLGATFWQTFFRVIFPLTLSGLMTGVVLVFVTSFAEFVIPELVGGDKFFFVGNLITHYFLVARNASAGAAFTIVSSLVVLGAISGIYAFVRSAMPGAMRGKKL